MITTIYEPITYTNQPDEKSEKSTNGIFFFFSIATLVFIIVAIFMGFQGHLLWAIGLPILALISGGIAAIFFPWKRDIIYSYRLDDTGLHQSWKNTTTGKMEEVDVSFEDMDRLLIGIYSQRISMGQGASYFRFESLIILQFGDRYFSKLVPTANELDKWVVRLKAQGVRIDYTDYDLTRAFHSHGYALVDFSKVPGQFWDVVSQHLGEEKFSSRFEMWMPENLEETVEQRKKEIELPKTRKAERNVLAMLFSYAIFFGLFLMPGVPLGDDGIVISNVTVIIGHSVLNWVIPCILIFWRSHTKWYNPILYAVVVAVGNFLGLSLASFFTEVSQLYESVVVLNIMNLIVWSASLIPVKIVKFIARYMHKRNI